MNLKNVHFKELLFLLVILVLLKFGINVIYDSGYFSPENIKYTFSTMKMESINTTEFGELLQTKNQNEPVLIYMGRITCPVCVDLLPKIQTTFSENQKLKNGKAVQQYYFDSKKYKSEESKALRESINANYVPSVILIDSSEVFVFDADDIRESDFSSKIANLLSY